MSCAFSIFCVSAPWSACARLAKAPASASRPDDLRDALDAGDAVYYDLQVGKIFDLLIEELRQRLVRKGLGLVVKPAAKKHLIDRGYSTQYGARPLRRVIEDEVEHAIAEGVLEGKYEKGDILEVAAHKGEISIGQRTESAAYAATETA